MKRKESNVGANLKTGGLSQTRNLEVRIWCWTLTCFAPRPFRIFASSLLRARRFSPTVISKAIRRKPYRGRVPPLSSPVISPITTNLICNGLGPPLLRPYLLGQYILQLLQISKSIAKITSALTRRLPGKSSTARRFQILPVMLIYFFDQLWYIQLNTNNSGTNP
ncbi:hypothetical protein YC2023_017550 [Brassica napus]